MRCSWLHLQGAKSVRQCWCWAIWQPHFDCWQYSNFEALELGWLHLQRNRERLAPLVLGALQHACEAAPPGGTASLSGPHIGGVPVCACITAMSLHPQ